jgi:hypothetical protein
VPAVRAFVDYLVEMLDPEMGKFVERECPEHPASGDASQQQRAVAL